MRKYLCSLAALPFAFGFTATAEPKASEWNSTAGSKVMGIPLGTEGDTFFLKLESDKTINARYSQLVKSDQLKLKQLLTRQAARSASEDAKETDWRNHLVIPSTGSESRSEEERFIVESKRCRIMGSNALDLHSSTYVVTLLEGTIDLLAHISPILGETPESPYEIHLFETLEALTEASGEETPGYSFESDSLNLIWPTVGLARTPDNEVTVIPIETAFARRAMAQSLLDQRDAIQRLPYWLYQSLLQYAHDTPHRGAVFFPGLCLSSLTESHENIKAATGDIAYVLTAPFDGYFEPPSEILRGRSPTAFNKAVQLSSLASLFHFLSHSEKTRALIDEIITSAVTGDPNISEDDAKNLHADDTNRLREGISADEYQKEIIATATQMSSKKRGATVDLTSVGRNRQWKNLADKSLQGSLIGFREGTVSIKIETTGKVARVPLKTLSSLDRIYTAFNLGRTVEFASGLANLGSAEVVSNRRWPSRLEAPDGVTHAYLDQRRSKKGRYIYKTKSFEFIVFADVPLEDYVMKDVARIFEGTRELLSKSPIGIQANPVDGFFRAELFDTEQKYFLAGGPQMSSGVYKPNTQKFLVPFKSLGLKFNGTHFIANENFEVKTLVHELTHMMMHDILDRLPIWLSEGTAEYTEAIPLSAGRVFECAKVNDGIKAINSRYQRARVPSVIDFEKLMVMSRREWFAISKSEPLMQISLYHSSLLLTAYFMNNERESFLAFLEEKRKEAPLWTLYDKEYMAFQRQLVEFKKLPGVKSTEDGGINYPSYLSFPARPMKPESADNVASAKNLAKLLNGRSVEQVASTARTWAVRLNLLF